MNRRDFLKLSALLSAVTTLTSIQSPMESLTGKKPNIVILLADAMSAENLSLYGYRRHTTPNLERWAERAIIYHSHYSGGNYTTPGTASMLTGLYPWSHRAVNLGSIGRRSLVDRNLFHLIGQDYQRVGFAQNLLADLYLRQYIKDLDRHIPLPTFMYEPEVPLISQAFVNDQLSAFYAIDNFLLSTQDAANPRSGSASMGYLGLFYRQGKRERGQADYEHPNGMPSNGYYSFKNQDVYEGILQTILGMHEQQGPFLGYFHLWSPHSNYAPTREFVDSLEEVEFPTKQYHPLGGHAHRRTLLEYRKTYDEYVANVDSEMGRLLDALDKEGILEDTYFIITSDHGEFFERGEVGHTSSLLYNPIIHIPLMVLVPGQTERKDVTIPTSNTDLMPTLLSIAGRPIPEDLEGNLLPGLGGDEKNVERPVFSVEAKEASSFRPLSRVSLAMIKGTKKIIHYKGYKKYPDAFELYDLGEDDEEKRDLYKLDTVTAIRMKEELLDYFHKAELPFQNGK